MLTIIGLMPTTYALNPQAHDQLNALSRNADAAIPLIQKYGDDLRDQALRAADVLRHSGSNSAGRAVTRVADTASESRATESQLRGDIYYVLGELKHVGELKNADAADKTKAGELRKQLGMPVQYAPIWVRVLSAVCLGAGTMVGYQRVVRTLGERLGKAHMTPGQGASAELVGSVLISSAGFTGLPVSTTHIITSGIAGTMIAGGQGVQRRTLVRILLAWVFTLPATMLILGVLFYVLNNPRF